MLPPRHVVSEHIQHTVGEKYSRELTVTTYGAEQFVPLVHFVFWKVYERVTTPPRKMDGLRGRISTCESKRQKPSTPSICQLPRLG